MRAHLLGSLLFASLFTGCVIEGEEAPDGVREIGDGGALVTADLRFTVTLDGKSCGEVPEVRELALLVTSSGGGVVREELALCPPAQTELVVPGLLAGRYAWRLEALDDAGATLFVGDGSVVLGSTDESILAALTSGATGEDGALTFLWDFGGLTCEEAGVDLVRIVLPGFDETVPCAPDGAEEGATISGLPAGAITFALTGLNAAGGAAFVGNGATVVPAQGEQVEELSLTPQGNVLELVWTFDGQGSCPLAGVERVHVAIRNADGLVTELDRACTDGLARIPGLTLGAYTIGAVGKDAAGDARFEVVDAPAQLDGATTRVVVDLPVVP